MTVSKTTVTRNQPKETINRDYKQFDSSKFKNELKSILTKEIIDSCTKFDEQFLKVLNSLAPYISKTLREALMKRSSLEKVYFKKRADFSLKA